MGGGGGGGSRGRALGNTDKCADWAHTHAHTTHLSAWSPLAVSGPVTVATRSDPQAPQGAAEPAPAKIGSPLSVRQLGTAAQLVLELTRKSKSDAT